MTGGILQNITTEQVLDGIAAALKARQLEDVVFLLHILAVKDPTAAETILAAIDLAAA